MKKISILALALALTGILCACNRGNMTGDDTTGMTTPSVITTVPTTQDNNSGSDFRPDQDGIIGESNPTDTTEPSQEPRHRNRLRIR